MSMSSNSSSTSPISEVLPSQESIDTSPNAGETIEWNYSGKAMRARCLLNWFISFVVLAGMVYLTFTNNIPETIYSISWIVCGACLVLLWVHFYVVYFYRVWTMRYKLTPQQLYSYEGLFTKKSDSMELLYIDDLQLIVTLWDRILNGGVGKIIVHSTSDKTHEHLTLAGIENPNHIFETMNEYRSKVRAKRGFISG
ncbi:MAG: PH domain-containing protein [Thermoguttaceae bacterium]